MQDFQYNCIKNRYGDKAEMLRTGADSLMYKIEIYIKTKFNSLQ